MIRRLAVVAEADVDSYANRTRIPLLLLVGVIGDSGGRRGASSYVRVCMRMYVYSTGNSQRRD